MSHILRWAGRRPHRPRLGPVCAAATFLVCCMTTARAQDSPARATPQAPRSLAFNQTRYRIRAGESTRVDASRETLDFLLRARTRRVEIDGKEVRGIVIGTNRAGDLLLSTSLAMKPGEYTLNFSATADGGDKRAASLSVTVDAITTVPSSATQPPVVLLNGWQLFSLSSLSSCPVGNNPVCPFS